MRAHAERFMNMEARSKRAAFAGLLCAAGLGAGLLLALPQAPAGADGASDQAATYSDVPAIYDTPAAQDDSGDADADSGSTDGSSSTSPAPTLIASRSDIPELSAGESAEVQVTFQNTGDTAVVQPIVSFTPSSGLVIEGTSSTFALNDIEAHGTQTVTLTVRALDGSGSSAQSLDIQAKYNYEANGTLEQGSTQDSVPIPCSASSSSDDGGSSDGDSGSDDSYDDSGYYSGSDYSYDDSGSGGDVTYDNGSGGTATTTSTASTVDKPTPNVIVSNFTYGDGTGSVAAGSTFNLTFSFTNTSTSLNVENLVVSVDTGDAFTISNGTNTFYSANLAANATQQQSLTLKAVSSDKATTGSISITFKYEYVENSERKTASTDVRLTVPVYLPDRFELTSPTAPEGATVGTESTVSLSYVNKGKSAVSNVAVSIKGDGITATNAVQNVGNIDSGKSGTIGFAFTPNQSGTLNLTLVVEYENANDETVTKEFPLTVTVEDDPYANMSDEELAAMYGYSDEDTGTSEDTGLPAPAIAAICIAVAAVIGCIVGAVRHRRKKLRDAYSMSAADDDWENFGSNVIPLDQVPSIPRGQDTIQRDRPQQTTFMPPVENAGASGAGDGTPAGQGSQQPKA